MTSHSAVLVCDCGARVLAGDLSGAWVLMARHERAAHPGRQEAQRHVRDLKGALV